MWRSGGAKGKVVASLRSSAILAGRNLRQRRKLSCLLSCAYSTHSQPHHTSRKQLRFRLCFEHAPTKSPKQRFTSLFFCGDASSFYPSVISSIAEYINVAPEIRRPETKNVESCSHPRYMPATSSATDETSCYCSPLSHCLPSAACRATTLPEVDKQIVLWFLNYTPTGSNKHKNKVEFILAHRYTSNFI